MLCFVTNVRNSGEQNPRAVDSAARVHVVGVNDNKWVFFLYSYLTRVPCASPLRSLPKKKKKSRPALRQRTRDQLIHQRLLRTLRGVRGGGP